ncbi:MlaE family ABC transporter permease [Thermodesulfobacteriota bacterium]
MDAAIEGTKCELGFSQPTEDTLLLRFSGDWRVGQDAPPSEEVEKQLQSAPGLRQVTFDTRDLTEWDSLFLTFLIKVFAICDQDNITSDRSGLPEGVRRLLELAFAVPEKKDTGKGGSVKESFLYRLGDDVFAMVRSAGKMLDFIGAVSVAFLKFLVGKAAFRRSDLVFLIQDCGAQSLPIVSLISFLVGLILAFVGAVQLQMFGAQIYVADLVGIAMVREMGAMMAGIIMAGRTGAAFAAQLGTMQVNEEIDALTTMGISPMEFLVLPRMLALVLMMPLLCLYADLVGILGGLVVGVGMLDLTLNQYYLQTVGAISLTNVVLGVIKSVVYGALIAVSGCLRGIECGRSASAVGEATTSAVVTAIVAIIVSDGIFNVITSVLGI